eukprot:GGOE01002503.1.p2 GENE.GGOE01002503.1~~GGOE01002503.1.p2  ORF type:complete len:445 (+),score=128.67 GGOE01002503.1:71-1405(+)
MASDIGDVEQLYEDDWESPEDWECPRCHWINWGWLERCEGCDGRPPPPKPPRSVSQGSPATPPSTPDIAALIQEIKLLKEQICGEPTSVNKEKRRKRKKEVKELTQSLRSGLQLQLKMQPPAPGMPTPRQCTMWPGGAQTPVILSSARTSVTPPAVLCQPNPAPLPAFDLEDQLSQIVGLMAVKAGLRSIATSIKAHQRRAQRGLAPRDLAMMCHMLFIGKAGTGKTTVARVVARLLHHLGLLSQGHVLEVSAKDLIAGHCGQTALKTAAMCAKAYGGVLFIDEAYSINPKGESAFGRECVDTLIKEMEDHRDKLVVMMAGYPQSMQRFLETNEGLRSRFNERFTFQFEEYTLPELAQIFTAELTKRNYQLHPSLQPRLEELIERFTTIEARQDQNGRLMRTLAENCIANQNGRWVDMEDDEVTDEVMVTVLEEDFHADSSVRV